VSNGLSIVRTVICSYTKRLNPGHRENQRTLRRS